MFDNLEIIDEDNKKDEVNLNDRTIVNRLKHFKNKLTTENLVSSTDILSLEEFIGTNIITKNIDKKKYSKYPSNLNVDDTIDVVDDILDKVTVTDHISLDDVIYLLRRINAMLNDLEYFGGEYLGNETDKVLRLLNEKYVVYYDENESVFRDISKDRPISDVFRYNSDLLSMILNEYIKRHIFLNEDYFISLENNLNIEALITKDGVNKYLNGELTITDPFTIKRYIDSVVYSNIFMDNLKAIRSIARSKYDIIFNSNTLSIDLSDYKVLKTLYGMLDENPIFYLAEVMPLK